MLLEWVLPRFRALHTDFSLKVTADTSERIQQTLSSREKGIGIFTSIARTYHGLEYIPLHADRLVMLAPPGSTNSDIVLLQPAGGTIRAIQEVWIKELGLKFKTVLEMPTFHAALDGMLMGQGYACVLETMAAHFGLEAVAEIPPLPFHVLAAHPQNMVFHPAARELLKIIIEAFSHWSYGHLEKTEEMKRDSAERIEPHIKGVSGL